MNDIKRILIVSRYTRECKRAVRLGISMAEKYGADLYLLHTFHDPLLQPGWSFSNLLHEEYDKAKEEAEQELDKIIQSSNKNGSSISVIIREGSPTKEIMDVVKEKEIDLIIMVAFPEGRLEHFIFGRTPEELHRKMPCSILFVKEEIGPHGKYVGLDESGKTE